MNIQIPLFISSVRAGFPSPAEDFLDKKLDLNEYLISNPESTFFVRVSGDSMNGIGILSGDILIVNRSKRPTNGEVAVVALNGELAVKKISYDNQKIYLISENPKYKAIEILEDDSLIIWGKVTGIIRKIC